MFGKNKYKSFYDKLETIKELETLDMKDKETNYIALSNSRRGNFQGWIGNNPYEPTGKIAFEPTNTYGAKIMPFFPEITLKGITRRIFRENIFDSSEQDHTFSNANNFREIQNLPELLNQMCKIMQESVEKEIPIQPIWNFGLRFKSDINKYYDDNAELVFIKADKYNIDNYLQKDMKLISANLANTFVDIYLGMNYVSEVINNEELRENVIFLDNQLVIKGVREAVKLEGFENYKLNSYKNSKYEQRYKEDGPSYVFT